MKKIILFSVLSLMVFFLLGCGVNNVPKDTPVDTKTESVQEQERSVFEEKKGIFTDTISFGEGDSFYGEIKKHKSLKTAEIEALLALNNSEEVTEGFDGESLYMAPALVNMMCNVMNLAIFAPEELEALTEKGDAQEDSDMWDHLEGYSVTKLAITFIDAEDKSQIAKCVSAGKDSLEFVAYKKYDPEKSFFGVEIGVFE